VEREAEGRGGALRRAALALVLTSSSACVVRGAMPDGPDASGLPASIPDVVRCQTGALPVELSGWRRSVARAVRGRWPDAVVDAASLTCRLVAVGQRPVVSGTSTPWVMTLAETELELSVELRFTRVTPGCVRQVWLAPSRWRVVPVESGAPTASLIVDEAVAALADAARQAEPSSETRLPCPAL
jgi:hypothetical protein